MVEVHPDPDNACSDGPRSLDLPAFAELADTLLGQRQQVQTA
jgi:3-deoxy-D-arabino-heptulosonate 7-phosphate (DAHP) synthase